MYGTLRSFALERCVWTSDFSFMDIHDVAELLQSHSLIIWNQFYADYRFTSLLSRSLKQIIITAKPDETLKVPYLQVNWTLFFWLIVLREWWEKTTH